ncbi:hypothetical protein JTE90_022627 [Oedothorax gibbosus]|uniref:Uncharacterized protein n=1 Tax=Oedothorax gibbosus TaxID=931172 RepID=A0AAV6TTB1_9ARAC|nr:hypothetical protein JTE90_022627 [Oedothorax gibbosus]
MAASKRVHFDETFNETISYPAEPLLTNPDLQDATDRLRIERQHPTELDKVRHLFQKCRDHDFMIVYGNLGRNPIILTYFLDLCFSAQESVGVLAPWSQYKTPYKVKTASHLDYVFVIEPYFGKHLVKFAKHVIVLTSHLSLTYPPSTPVYFLRVGRTNQAEPEQVKPKGSVFVPPAFHQNKLFHLQRWTHLDIQNAKSAHDAFMKLLTGRELIPEGPYTLDMSPRDDQIIRWHLEKTKQVFQDGNVHAM